jgi:hypothetical protein
MTMTGLSGSAAVLAAIGLSADSKDAVPRAALDSAITAALAEGEKIGVVKAGNDAAKITAEATKAANARAKAILGHAEAKGREDMARHLAFDTDMSAEAAGAMLGKAPKAAAPSSSRLGDIPDPRLSADENTGREKETAASWDDAAANVNKRYGLK